MTDFTRNRPMIDKIAEALGKAYTIEREIGRGGMGVVYRARDEQLQRTVAIKVLPPELAHQPEIRERFAREARTAARLTHPHIVPIYAVGEASGLVYFSMGFVDGESLADLIRRENRISVEEARRIMAETADALGAAHAVGIIHRDIKPDNILLQSASGQVMVTDFGIAKALSEAGSSATLTGIGVAIGTPSYMSPEQAAGDREIDGRSDLYSLGVVAYQMLTGALPFSSPTIAGILMKHITEPAPDVRIARPEVPDDLAIAIARCLEKDPDDRWANADVLCHALATGATSDPGDDRQARERHKVNPRRTTRREAKKKRAEKLEPIDTGEPRVVQKVRAQFTRWAAISLGLFGINIATGIDTPWFLFPMFGMSFGVLKSYGVLWQSGYSWRDVLKRPPAPDALETTLGVSRLPPMPTPPSSKEFGVHLEAVQQVHSDREAIQKILDNLPPAEHRRLPEIRPTVEALYRRALELARTLHAMDGHIDPKNFAHIDERLAAVAREPEDAERERRLDLLKRQRQALVDLQASRAQSAGHLESCVLTMQNLRFDLLRVQSAGMEAVLSDLAQATQQARALSRDLDHVIAAADEVRDVLK